MPPPTFHPPPHSSFLVADNCFAIAKGLIDKQVCIFSQRTEKQSHLGQSLRPPPLLQQSPWFSEKFELKAGSANYSNEKQMEILELFLVVPWIQVRGQVRAGVRPRRRDSRINSSLGCFVVFF